MLPFHKLRQLLVFVFIFAALQWTWRDQHDSAFERFFIEDVTVRTAVGLVNTLTPSIKAVAMGTHMTAPGGGINVLNGCEGVEVMFLLLSAMVIAPIPWKVRIAGAFSGLVYVFFFNQLRLLVMFYTVRTNRELFELLHGIVAPLFLVALTGLFFAAWLARFSPHFLDQAASSK